MGAGGGVPACDEQNINGTDAMVPSIKYQLATNEHVLLNQKLGKASSAHPAVPNDEYLSNIFRLGQTQ